MTALNAFTQCGHDADKLRTIEEEWRLKELKFTDLDDEARYIAFKTFYIRKLKNLYANRPIKQAKARANYSHTGDEDEDSGDDELMELKQTINDLQSHQVHLMDAVSTTLQGLELNQPTASVEVPSVAGTIGSTMW